MRRTVELLLATLLSLLMGGCVKSSDLRIIDVENVGMHGLSNLTATLSVENLSRRTVKISDAELLLFDSDQQVCRLSLSDVLAIKPNAVQSVTVPIRMELDNPLVAMSLMRKIRARSPLLTVKGSLRVGVCGLKRKFSIEQTKLNDFIANFDEIINRL